MSATWSLEPFDPNTASPAAWRAFHAYRRARADEEAPGDPITPDARFEAQWRKPSPDWWERDVVVWEGDRIVGSYSAEGPKPHTVDFAANGHLIFVGGGVLGPWRRQGIGRAMLRRALADMDDAGARVLTTHSHEPDGQAFLAAHGVRVVSVLRYSRLDWTEIDWGQVDRWIAEGERRAPEIRLELHDRRIPEPLWAEACAARTALGRLIPRDAMDMGDWTMQIQDQREMYERMDINGSDHHVVFARDAAGRIVGITDVAWEPDKPTFIWQYFTGVHPDARGKGVGKRLKAAMLLHLRGRYPDAGLRWMQTDNSSTNAPMLAINERLGFREHKLRKTYQAEREALEAALGAPRGPGPLAHLRR